ncbi:MAG: hypothetical protein WBC68_14505 [Albidovulum sp.]
MLARSDTSRQFGTQGQATGSINIATVVLALIGTVILDYSKSNVPAPKASASGKPTFLPWIFASRQSQSDPTHAARH